MKTRRSSRELTREEADAKKARDESIDLAVKNYGWRLFIKGLKRRRKEVCRMRIMACIAVFFLVFTMLLQDNLNAFQKVINDEKYGSWLVRSHESTIDDLPVIKQDGVVFVGSDIYLTHPLRSGQNDLPPYQTIDDAGHYVYKQPPITNKDGSWLPPENEITVADQGNWRNTSFKLGAFSGDFCDNCKIALYDGRFPESDSEIVMERDVVLKLGGSYDLGQELTFYVAKPFRDPEDAPDRIDPETGLMGREWDITLVLKTYTLVGTIEKYTNRWADADALPNAIITESAYNSLKMNKTCYRFYGLIPDFDDSEPWDVAELVFDQLTPESELEGREYVFNRVNYSRPFWGSRPVYRGVTLLLMLLSAGMLSFLMATYLIKRRRALLRMREIGASTAEVWGVSAYECLRAVLPAALISLVVSFALCAGTVSVLSKLTGYDVSFVMKPKTVVLILIVIAGVIAASLIAALLVLAGRGLVEKKTPMGRSASRSIKKRAQRKTNKAYLGISESSLRDKRINRGKTVLLRIVSTVLCALIIFCATRLFVSLYFWLKMSDEVAITGVPSTANFGIQCKVDTEPHLRPGSGSQKLQTTDKVIVNFRSGCYSMDKVMPDQAVDELREIAGVKELFLDTLDPFHHLEWDGWLETPFIKACTEAGIHYPPLVSTYKLTYDGKHLESFRECMGGSFFRLFCLGDTEKAWAKAKKHLGSSADYKAFLRGEQVIVLVDENAEYLREAYAGVTSQGEPLEAYIPDGNVWQQLGASFAAGDTVSVARTITANNEDPSSVPVTIAAVIPMDVYSLQLGKYAGGMEIAQSLFTVIGSPELAKKVMEAEGREYGVNCISVNFDRSGYNDNAIKSVIRCLNKNGMNYDDNTEVVEIEHKAFRESLTTFGVIGLAMLILFLLMQSSVADDERNRLSEKFNAMKRLGASDGELKRKQGVVALKEALWLLPAVPLAFIIGAVSSVSLRISHLPDLEAKLNTIMDMLKTPASSASEVLENYDFNIPIALITIALLVLAVWLINRRTPKTQSSAGRRQPLNKRFTRPAGE